MAMATKQSSAHAFGYTNQASSDAREIERKFRVVKKKRKLISSFTIVMFLVSMVVCGIILYCNMVLTQCSDEIWRLNNEINDLGSQEIYLKAQYDESTNLQFIEEYASDNLGMVKIDQSRFEYIDLENRDVIEIGIGGYNRISEVFSQFVRSFSAVLEYIR